MLIYDRFATVTVGEERMIGEFLRKEYERECLNFPGVPPPFEPAAAIWGARTVFNAAQLLLSREKGEEDMLKMLPRWTGVITASTILSADLCLRCMPDVIAKAAEISPEDPLIAALNDILRDWHYSGVGISLQPEGVEGWGDFFDWEPILNNGCLHQLYIDRVIERRVLALARLPQLKPGVLAVMGDHPDHFWKELNT